jgi:replicative DNA helicase
MDRLPPDATGEMWSGELSSLYEAIRRQYEDHGKIDVAVLKKKHSSEIADCLEMQGTYSKAALDVLREHAMRRSIGRMILNIQGAENPTETLNRIQQEISSMLFSRKDAEYDHRAELLKLKDMIDRGRQEKRDTAGYSTGIKKLDALISGIEPGKMYAIGGLKKTGKSRLAVCLSARLAEQGAGVFWNSLEMTRLQLNTLATAYYTGIDSSVIGRAINDSQNNEIEQSYGKLINLNWSIYREKTVAELKSRILHERQKKKINAVFVDYIQRMEYPELRRERVKEIERIAISLADLSRELNVAVVVLSQLKGEAENLQKNEMPTMAHFKESQAIPENADVICTLHNFDRGDAPFTAQGSYIAPTIHCKVEQRYFVSGPTIKMHSDLRNCRFYDSD